MRYLKYTQFMTGLATLLLVTSCGSTVKKVKVASEEITDPNILVWELDNLASVNVALAGHGYSGDALAQSMASSAQTPAPAGAGFAGALIGGAISKSIQVSAAQKKMNERVKELLAQIEASNWQQYFTEYTNFSGEIIFDYTRNKELTGTLLKLTPSLEITSNYMSMELHVLAEVAPQSAPEKVLYRNYIHIQSPKLLDSDESLSDLNNKDMEFLRGHLEQLIKPVVKLVSDDLTRASQGPLALKPIRFNNHMGKYFEMGYLLDQKEEYIAFKTLRGEIKYYPTIE